MFCGESTHLLRELLLALEDNNRIGVGWNNSVRAMCKLLDGGHNFDVKFALDAPVGPDGPLSESNASAYREFERLERFREWGRMNIETGGHEKFPPKNLW